MNPKLRTYLEWRWRISNHNKYQKYRDLWIASLTPIQIMYFEISESKIHLFSMPSNSSQNIEKGNGSYNTYVFPTWKICNDKHDGIGTILYDSFHSKNNKCPICGEDPSTNVRFVLACCDGHLDDIPWDYAVHGSNNSCNPKYYFWKDRGSSFSDIAEAGSDSYCWS